MKMISLIFKFLNKTLCVRCILSTYFNDVRVALMDVSTKTHRTELLIERTSLWTSPQYIPLQAEGFLYPHLTYYSRLTTPLF